MPAAAVLIVAAIFAARLVAAEVASGLLVAAAGIAALFVSVAAPIVVAVLGGAFRFPFVALGSAAASAVATQLAAAEAAGNFCLLLVGFGWQLPRTVPHLYAVN